MSLSLKQKHRLAAIACRGSDKIAVVDGGRVYLVAMEEVFKENAKRIPVDRRDPDPEAAFVAKIRRIVKRAA